MIHNINILFFLFVLPLFITCGLQWIEPLSRNQRHILFFRANWCGSCKKMEKSIWTNKQVKKIIQDNKYRFHSIDVDKKPEYSKGWGVKNLPTTIITISDGKTSKEISHKVGYVNSSSMVKWLVDNKDIK